MIVFFSFLPHGLSSSLSATVHEGYGSQLFYVTGCSDIIWFYCVRENPVRFILWAVRWHCLSFRSTCWVLCQFIWDTFRYRWSSISNYEFCRSLILSSSFQGRGCYGQFKIVFHWRCFREWRFSTSKMLRIDQGLFSLFWWVSWVPLIRSSSWDRCLPCCFESLRNQGVALRTLRLGFYNG